MRTPILNTRHPRNLLVRRFGLTWRHVFCVCAWRGWRAGAFEDARDAGKERAARGATGLREVREGLARRLGDVVEGLARGLDRGLHRVLEHLLPLPRLSLLLSLELPDISFYHGQSSVTLQKRAKDVRSLVYSVEKNVLVLGKTKINLQLC